MQRHLGRPPHLSRFSAHGSASAGVAPRSIGVTGRLATAMLVAVFAATGGPVRFLAAQGTRSAEPSTSGFGQDPGSSMAPAATPPQIEYTEEAKQLAEEFEQARLALAEATADLRATQIRYRNDINRSPAAVREYRERRDLARERLNEAYDIAVQLVRLVPDKEAARFMLTLIQMRTGMDHYDEGTFTGAAMLLQGGLKQLFVIKAAIRSAICIGEFDTARQLLKAVDEEALEDCDLLMREKLDQIAEQYRQEMQHREKDADRELPRVLLRTTRGDILVELFLDQAPSTVSHFIRLVEQGFYDDLDFYQVKDRLFALTGDPSGNGTGNSGQFLIDEHDRPDARPALRGSLVMAKQPTGPGQFEPNTGSSQFSISYLPVPGVTDQLTVFGRVIEGMDVACYLRRVDPFEEKGKGKLVLPPDRILTAEVVRRPEKLPEPEYVQMPGGQASLR